MLQNRACSGSCATAFGSNKIYLTFAVAKEENGKGTESFPSLFPESIWMHTYR